MAQDMPMQEEAEPQEEGGGDIEALMAEYIGLGQAIAQFAQKVSQTPGVPEGMPEKLSKVMDMFAALGEDAAGGGEDGPMPADQGMIPMQGGAKGVPMGPQGKM